MQARNIANRSKKFYAVKRTAMAAAEPLLGTSPV